MECKVSGTERAELECGEGRVSETITERSAKDCLGDEIREDRTSELEANRARLKMIRHAAGGHDGDRAKGRAREVKSSCSASFLPASMLLSKRNE